MGTTCPVNSGQIIGWIEGFKATSDIYSVSNGAFIEPNPELEDDPDLMMKKPYLEGWLYKVRGQPDDNALTEDGYSSVLDVAIDKILEGE